MKVSYIGHSGFLVETEKQLYLFDYYKGDIPELALGKPLYVFVSHRHEDHFNPEIFRLVQRHPETRYVLAFDIRITPRNLQKWGLDESWKEKILTVRSKNTYDLTEDCRVETLRSTDEGVAFWVVEGEQTIFHAGDLNWWFWEGEDKSWLGTMEANFKREVERIAGRRLDVAFLPLDDRLEKTFYKGMDWYLRKCKVKYAFPMHFWQDHSVIERFEQLDCRKDYDTVICDTVHEKNWELVFQGVCS